MKEKYTEALCKEIRLRADAKTIDTIYIGGGTPSVLDIALMRKITDAVRDSFTLKPNAEITIEVNPGTLGDEEAEIADKLRAYREMGFNRLSMGVQTMNNGRLKFLGRIHSAEDVERDVRIAREAGFDNLNLDIIFSVPGESSRDALEDARKIVDLGPEHISCYSLQIEEGTPLCSRIEEGELTEVPDEDDRDTYHSICTFLKDSGYEHYEISNFAKNSYRSKHNSLYWDMSEYIGCGLGSSGFTGGVRYKNISDLDLYIRALAKGSLSDISEEKHVNTPFDNISEAVFTGLRRTEGIGFSEAIRAYAGQVTNEGLPEDASGHFWEIFSDAKAEAEGFAETGHLIIDEKGLRLTEKGIDISNSIMALFV